MPLLATEPIRAFSPNAPNANTPPMFGSKKLTICSVFFRPTGLYPIRVAATQADGGFRGMCEFWMPAAPRDGCVTMNIHTGVQFVRRPSQEDDGTWSMTPETIPPESIVTDLINRWSKSLIKSDDQVGPGIGVIAGDDPTEEELAELRSRQETWAQLMVDAASDFAITGKNREITDLHRGCARWLMGDAADQLPWMVKKTYMNVKNCVACGEQIMATAMRCRHCSVELPKFYRDYKLDPADDPNLVAFLAKQSAPRA